MLDAGHPSTPGSSVRPANVCTFILPPEDLRLAILAAPLPYIADPSSKCVAPLACCLIPEENNSVPFR